MPEIYRTDGLDFAAHDAGIDQVAQVLASGGLALIPTETVYGLSAAVAPLAAWQPPAGTASDAQVNGAPLPPPDTGYRRIFSVKRRELTQTVPWLVSGAEDLDRYGRDIDDATRALAAAFWPGALTLIVRANDRVPRFMQAADGTVALRASASPVIRALVRACGSPLAVTSANTHGAPAPASFEEVEPRILAGSDIALDAGATVCRDASTIVSCAHGAPEILRHAALPDERVRAVLTPDSAPDKER